jgi:anthraniloyl-CoA monooxygenase
MEDAIALHAAFRKGGTVTEALSRFEHDRREDVERTQHRADVSLVWFEQVRRFWGFSPVRFAFGVMTRAKAITWDNLALRAPEFVQETQATFAQEAQAAGLPADPKRPPLFQPFALRGMWLANRVVVSPMCMYSAEEGVPGDFHFAHYASRALGGAGLIFTEMTCPAPMPASRRAARASGTTCRRRPGRASSASPTRTRMPSSASSSAMPGGRGRRS